MRFSNYLNEAEDKFLEKEIKKFRTSCKPFLDHIIGNDVYEPLYRGTSKYLSMFSISRRRKNRKPKDTPEKVQKIADAIFYKEFKWKPRSSGVFATGSLSLADNYGRVFWFFPIGSFHFVWSNRIEDFFLDNDWDDFYKREWIENQGWKIIYNPGHTIGIEDRMDSIINTYQDFDLKSAISSGHEIMFDCDRYYLIDEKNFRNRLSDMNVIGKDNSHKLFDEDAYKYLIGVKQ